MMLLEKPSNAHGLENDIMWTLNQCCPTEVSAMRVKFYSLHN